MTITKAKKYTVKCNENGCNQYFYARGLCKRHYKMLLGREGGYIKDYQKRKDNPAYKKMKLTADKKYRDRLIELGLMSKKQHEYYLTYISKPENRDIKNAREKVRRANRSIDAMKLEAVMMRIRRENIKYEVLHHYSRGTMCCKECGIDVYPVLTIDHINNNGSVHRKEIGGKYMASPSAMYAWLKSHGYPEGYQVLCQNCNFFKDIVRRIRN